MDLSVDQHVPGDPGSVLAVLTDEDFMAFAARGSGVRTVETTVTTTDEGDVVVAVRRRAPSSMIPAQARPFVGDSIEIRHVEAWSQPREGATGARYGTFVAEVTGAPVQMTGNVRLLPDDDGEGSLLLHELTVKSSIPLVRTLVEQTTTDVVRYALEELGDAARRWLAGER